MAKGFDWKFWIPAILFVIVITSIYFIAANVFNLKTINDRYGNTYHTSSLKI
jgi:hypothetical protein